MGHRKKIRTNAQTTSPSGTDVIEDVCISESQAAANLNAYYKSFGGAAVDITPQKVPSGDTVKPLEHISLGEIKMLLSKLDRPKALNCTIHRSAILLYNQLSDHGE